MYVAGSIFKYADQEYGIVVRIERRLNIFKVTHMDAHIICILMSVCVDKAALF